MRPVFYLGTHLPNWLSALDVPLFVSHRRLTDRRSLPRARTIWALDSGGFSELSLYGEWRTTPSEYVHAVRRYTDEVGQLQWAAPQDWMCEPVMLAKTGLTVAEHQARTVTNLLELRSLASDLPFIPALQGWTNDDYLRCWDAYAAAGVDLGTEPVVGLGSVCRRQATGAIGDLVHTLRERDPAIKLHGFGIKRRGLQAYGYHLASADSMAWSYDARRRPPLPGCAHHRNCANCPHYALAWRQRVLDDDRGWHQPTLAA